MASGLSGRTRLLSRFDPGYSFRFRQFVWASDRIGAYPAADPVTPADLAATVYWRFGIDPAREVIDQTGRPFRLAEGEPVRRLFRGEA